MVGLVFFKNVVFCTHPFPPLGWVGNATDLHLRERENKEQLSLLSLLQMVIMGPYLHWWPCLSPRWLEDLDSSPLQSPPIPNPVMCRISPPLRGGFQSTGRVNSFCSDRSTSDTNCSWLNTQKPLWDKMLRAGLFVVIFRRYTYKEVN